MKLPDSVIKFAKIFKKNNFQIYLVGGAVRDFLYKNRILDYDFTTNALPEQVIRIFPHVIPVGIEHGTVMVLFEKNEFEVTTFRTEGKYSDSRHPDSVNFVKSIDEDLKRRDFTINALAYDISRKKLIDNFSGRKDLKNKIIKAIGNPEERFSEDHLRMMRACRFASQLEFTIADETLNAIKAQADGITGISCERIRDELIKIMNSRRPSVSFEYMRTTGLLKHILPELESGYGILQNKFHKHNVYYHNLYSCDAAPAGNYIIRLAALFHDIAKPQTKRGKEDDENENSFYNHEIIGARTASKILKRLKFSNNDIRAVSHLIKYHMFYYTDAWTDGAVRRFIRNVGVENLEDLFILREADRIGNGTKQGVPEVFINFKDRIRQILEIDSAFKIRDLDINGDDVMEKINLKSGPIIGEILNYLLELVLDNPELNSEEILLNKAAEFYNKKREYSLKNYGKNPEDLGKF
jgi:tRNA nucleotidyltransferase (CCA-adding enzyme)